MRLIRKILGIDFKSYSRKEKIKCIYCDKYFFIYHDLYGTSSGGGNCLCGAKLIIN